jgi:hypothetical protein
VEIGLLRPHDRVVYGFLRPDDVDAGLRLPLDDEGRAPEPLVLAGALRTPLDPLLLTGAVRGTLEPLERTGALRTVAGRLVVIGTLRDVAGRLDRTGALRGALEPLERTGALRVAVGRPVVIGVPPDVVGRLLVVARLGVALCVVTGVRRVVVWRVGVTLRVLVVTRLGDARRVGVVSRTAPLCGCLSVALRVRGVVLTLLDVGAVAFRAAGAAPGLSTVLRAALAVARLGAKDSVPLLGASRLVVGETLLATDARLTEEPSVPA